jgi:hypothetical protein
MSSTQPARPLSVFEYSQRVGVPERTVLKWCQSARLPSERDQAGRWLIYASELPTAGELRSLAERVAALEAQMTERDARLVDLQTNLDTWRSAWDDERRLRQDLARQSALVPASQWPDNRLERAELLPTGTDPAGYEWVARAPARDDLTVLAARLVDQLESSDGPLPEDPIWRHGHPEDLSATGVPVSPRNSRTSLVDGLVERTEPSWLAGERSGASESFEGGSIVDALRAWASSGELREEDDPPSYRGRQTVPPLRDVIAEDLSHIELEPPPSIELPRDDGGDRRGFWRFQLRRRRPLPPDTVQDRLERLRADLGLD